MISGVLQISYNRELSRHHSVIRSIVGILSLFILVPLLPAQTETQHVFNFPWRLGKGTDLILHSRARTRPGSLGLYQGRVGAILEVPIPGRTQLIAGYYYTEQEDQSFDWEPVNRSFGGLESVLAKWKGNWETRHLYETFSGPEVERYYRVRHRFGWVAPTRVAPFADVEYLWDRDGWRSTRYQGGTECQVSPRLYWNVHYFYEPRRSDSEPRARHMWGTTLEFRIGEVEPKKP